MQTLNRRAFVTSSTGLTVGARLGQTTQASARLGANDTIRVAVVGLHGRGRRLIDGFARLPGVKVVALCDVDEEVLGQQAKRLEAATKAKVDKCVDMREIFDRKDVDAVAFATPNHWHALGSIWACQSGKDVYVEKPCSHNLWEGRKLVEAARKYGRIVQHGTGVRSSIAAREAVEKLSQGVIGELYMAKGLCYKWRETIGRSPEEPVPPGVRYDLWLGPAPVRPFSRNRFHYNWHWHWDYGNGDIGNQGAHQMDLARWGLGLGLPEKVHSSGGHFMFQDDQQTPNVQLATLEYPKEKKLLVFEVRHWISNHEAGFGKGPDNEIGVVFFGSEGFMTVGDGYQTYLGKKQEPGPSSTGSDEDLHFANFIEGMRQRKPGLLTAEIEEGHLSAALCHLANISYRTGRSLRFDPAAEKFIGDPEADRQDELQKRLPLRSQKTERLRRDAQCHLLFWPSAREVGATAAAGCPDFPGRRPKKQMALGETPALPAEAPSLSSGAHLDRRAARRSRLLMSKTGVSIRPNDHWFATFYRY
ncbi:MAG: Gfo/Idh/MocA family protein [Acidobacteriota bacterium]